LAPYDGKYKADIVIDGSAFGAARTASASASDDVDGEITRSIGLSGTLYETFK